MENALSRDSLRPGVLAAALLLGPPSAALAHAILVSSQPRIDGTVSAGSVAMEFRFNSRIDRARSRLWLTGSDRTQAVLSILREGPEDVLRSRADLAPGSYSVRWQVLAVDGHITRGNVPFTVTAP